MLLPTLFQSTRPIRGATKASVETRIVQAENYFNPRAPYGARRTGKLVALYGTQDFNPRAPYGARRAAKVRPRVIILISIHAPHTGRDKFAGNMYILYDEFQSTRPIRGATCGQRRGMRLHHYFNPRAPYGARRARYSFTNRRTSYFNPRAPYGARREAGPDQHRKQQFQSTRPIRGATDTMVNALDGKSLFQSTRPIRGATAKMHNLCSAFLQQQTIKA